MSDTVALRPVSARLDDLAADLRPGLDAAGAAAVVCDHLVDAGPYMPSLYLERGGRLRCQAVRGYWQVLDGFPPTAGVIGHTFRTGVATHLAEIEGSTTFLEAVPGVAQELCVPIRAGGRVVGALNVECMTRLPVDAAELLLGAAELYARHLERDGGPRPESPAQRLARHAAVLAGLRDAGDIERRLLEAALDVTAMGTGLLVLHGRRRRRAVGPLGSVFDGLDDAGLAVMASWVASGTSCYTLGRPDGIGFGGLQLRDAGAGTVVVVAVQARGEHLGFLAVADPAPVPPHTDAIERLELLATVAAASLATADAVARLTAAAGSDPLTGLGHGRTFRADLAARRLALQDGSTLAVALVDIDHFKAVNDRLGHLAGDRVLVELAAALRASVEGSGVAYRIGGDELAVLVEVASSGAADAATSLGDGLRRAVMAAGPTVSVGIALAEAASVEPDDDLLTRADVALYAAKAAGRDRTELAPSPHPTG